MGGEPLRRFVMHGGGIAERVGPKWEFTYMVYNLRRGEFGVVDFLSRGNVLVPEWRSMESRKGFTALILQVRSLVHGAGIHTG